MKLPVPLLWRIIGDFFNREVFFDDEKRSIDALWQVMTDNSAEALKYIDQYRKSKNVFEVDPFAPWGTFGSIARPIGQSLDIDGVLIGGRQEDFWNWLLYTSSDAIPPSSGFVELFSSTGEVTPCASIAYDSVSFDVLNSGGTVIKTSGSGFTSGIPWNESENASYVFGPDTVLDGSGRWNSTGSSLPVGTENGIEFDQTWVNWGILQDRYFFDGGASWRQVWRMKVKEWDITQLERTISITSFGDTGNPFEVRLTDRGGSVTVGTGLFALTRQEVLTFSGTTITRGSGSFETDGFVDGMTIVISGTTSNNGTYTITSVTPLVINTVETLAAEVSSPSARVRADLDLMSGDTSSWQARLELANELEPVYLEFVINYTASTSSITSSVWLDGDRVQQTSPYLVSPGRRKHTVDMFNQYQNMKVDIPYIVAEGKLWNALENIDFSSSIGAEFTYKYEIDEPLVDSGFIRSEPWDLSPSATVISQTVNELNVELNEDWASYAPEYIRVFNDAGQWVVGKIQDQNGLDVTYEIVLQCELGVSIDGEITLHPWYLNKSEFTWVDTGVFGTSQPIPYIDRQSWFIDSMASEVDLYNRYAKVLGLGRQLDSQNYLNTIRGYQYGLLTPATREFTERAVGVMAGLPYAVNSGTLTSVTRFRDELGASLYDEVVVGGRAYKVNTIWSDNDLILPIGSIIPFMSPIVNGVKVFDHLNDIDKVQLVIDDIWSTWGTFLVQIPADIGVNKFSVESIISMINRKKDKDTDFVIEYITDTSENFATGRLSLVDPDTHETFAHTIEDMLFDDDGTVYQNPMNFQWQEPEDSDPYDEFVENNFTSAVHGWTLQEQTGTDAIDVVSGSDGVHDGGVVAGVVGIGDRFDYAADYTFSITTETTVANADWLLNMGPADNDSFTITAWVKNTSIGAIGVLGKSNTTGVGRGIHFSISPAGLLFVDVRDGVSAFLADTGSGNISDGNWHLLVARVDRVADELQCFDIEEDGTVNAGSVVDISTCVEIGSTDDLLIGRSDVNDSIEGSVAQVWAFQSALTDKEIYQLWRGQGALFSSEYQLSNTSTLDQGLLLDQFNNLDRDKLILNDVKYGWAGTELGPAPSRPSPKYIYRDSGTFLKRQMSATERSNQLSKNTLRFAKPNTYQNYWYRPYELCWLYTAASPAFSTRDGGGTLYTFPTPAWDDVSVGGMAGLQLEASWVQNTNWVIAVGQDGAVFTSSNYGHTWTDRSVAIGTDDFHGISATSSLVWIVGDNDRVYTQNAESNALGSTSITAGYDHKDIFFYDDDYGWTASDDGVDSYVIKTSNGGSTWGAPVSVVNGELAKSVHFIDANNGWFATDGGLYKTDDGGASWSVFDTGSFESVIMVSADIVIGVGLAGLARITANASDVTPTFGAITLPGTAGNLYDIWYDGFEIFVVGGTAASVGQIYRSKDTGSSWTLTTEGTEPFYGVFAIRPFERIIVRTGETFRWL